MKQLIMLRLLTILSLIFLFNSITYSQQYGTIEGTVIDSSNNSPLTSAAVSVINEKDNKVVTGANTEEDGKFKIEQIPFGNYKLEINYIGYNTLVIPNIKLSAGNNNIKVGIIKLKSGTTSTEEIEVRGEKSKIEFTGEKRILNVGEDLTLKGASALDVLKEMPGVTVDIDGNVSVRGSEGVKITIDNRPYGLEGQNRTATLEQISADQIDKVELITNPSVKYDPEGSSGIINIILKKKREFGYNGALSLNAGTNDKYSGGLNLNYRKDNFNVNGSYNYNKFNFNSERNSLRNNFSDEGDNTISQTGSGFRRREMHNIKGGIDYSISKYSNLGFSLNYRGGTGNSNQTTYSTQTDANNALISEFYRRSFENSNSTDLDFSLNFTQIFKNNSQHKLTSDFSFSNEPDEDSSYSNDEDIIPPNPTPEKLLEIEIDKDKNYQLAVDYTLPISKETRFEAGYKGTRKESDEDYTNSFFDYNTNQYVLNTSLSNRFNYTEQIQGLYSSFTGKLWDFGILLGGRIENTNSNGDLITIGENFKRNYFAFFPSLSISKKLGITQEIQASYSRRIRRPRQENLNPFLVIEDRYNLSKGNPDLKPEYTNSFELNYINYTKIGTFTPSIFFRRTTDEITRTRTLIDSVTTLTTFENLNSSNTYGAELLISSQPINAIGINGNISYFRTDVTGNNLGELVSNSAYSWSSRLSTNINLPLDFGVQLSYNYSGKRVTAQGIYEPLQTMDAAVKKDFFDKNLTISFRVNDLFNTAKFTYNLNDPNFTETAERRRDSRNFFLNLSYKFGIDEKQKRGDGKKRNEDNENEDDGDIDY